MRYHLAQLNIAKMIAPLNDPIMLDFVNNTDRINALAEQSKGFVWRLKEEAEYIEANQVFQDNLLAINMSVWENPESLFDFTYHSGHVAIMKRKKEWFSKLKEMHMVLWFVENGQKPTPKEAKHRLEYLRKHGDTPYAFSFRSKFSSEDYKTYKVITS